MDTVTITGQAQRAAWLSKTMPPIEQLRTDLWSIPVPIPQNPLRYTSVYVLAGESDITLIDTGTNTDDGWRALRDGLASIGASVTDVKGCLVTHFHFDHLGLAARLRSTVGAWIGLHPADVAAVNRPEFRSGERGSGEDFRWLTFLGASRAQAQEVLHDVTGVDPRDVVTDPERLIEDGDAIKVDGWSLRAVHTPGHTPGHLCFVDENSRLLFAGDHLLPRISPNVSADRRSNVDALGDFLASLDKVAEIDADEVLPAHEWRFRGLHGRVAELHLHHERRLAELLEVVRRHPGRVPWELAGELTWSRPWSQYGGVMRFSAVGETAAHLIHLVRRGDVVASDDAVPRYTVAAKYRTGAGQGAQGAQEA